MGKRNNTLKGRFKALWNPEQYHGWGRKKRFFEGWYYKVIDETTSSAYAFIPGIAMDKNGEKQAFIQVLDGKSLTATYHRFDAAEFKPQLNKHDLHIGKNRFSTNHISLDLPNIKGELHFEQISPWPSSWYSPGIMGPFSFIPKMECYHGILSMNHTIRGKLVIDNSPVDFTNGHGYTEKDWGHSFPEGYIWMQSNHFSQKGISVKASVAKIPWMGTSFIGFIAGVKLPDRIIQFTTYNFTRLKHCAIDEEKTEIILENRKHLLEISAYRDQSTELASPIGGFMDGRIEESMNARLEIKLTDKKQNQVLLEDIGTNAGLEIAGNYHVLTTK